MTHIDLTLGGRYFGTPEQCLTFLRHYPDMVRDKDQLLKDYHWSNSKGQWVYIKDMHPAYIRHVLVQGLEAQSDNVSAIDYEFIKCILSDSSLSNELVGQMVSLWYEMCDIPHDHKRELMLTVLQNKDKVTQNSAYGGMALQ